MKTLAQVTEIGHESTESNNFTVDTTFVLFFLAVEFGQIIGNFDLVTAFFGLTLITVAALPYFLLREERESFASWIIGRSLITAFAISVGIAYKQSLGLFLPEAFKFLPMTLLIITAMLSCYIQFYGLLKLRLAK